MSKALNRIPFIVIFKTTPILFCLGIVATTSLAGPVFQESDGVVVMEVESVPAPKIWRTETKIPGWSGESYYVATESSRKSPGDGLLEYAFVVGTPGEYQLQWRSFITDGEGNPGKSSTDENDTWVRLVDANGKVILPQENDLKPKENWYKIYMNRVDTWVWDASNHDHNPRAIFWNLQPDQEYVLQVSVRSKGHAIDKILLWNRDGTAYGNETGRTNGAQGKRADLLKQSKTATH